MAARYDGIGLYHDRDDPRLFVPKRDPLMGWTVNVDHRRGPLVLAAIGAAAFGAIAAAVIAARG